jgi:hypothetical protein
MVSAVALAGGCAPLPASDPASEPAPGPGPAPAPTPELLAHSLPAVSPAVYTIGDTATFTVDSGPMGGLTVAAAYTGVARFEVWPSDQAFEASVRFLQFHGTLSSNRETRRTVDETHIDGAFSLRFDARGRVEVTDTPALSTEILEIAGPESLVRPLFVHLPDRLVRPGELWVDTVASAEESPESRSEAYTIITTTLVGDTIFEGRTLLLLRTRAHNRIETTGQAGGVQVRQRLMGTTTGTVVWDPALRLMVERREDGYLAGTLAMPTAGVAAMPMSARVRRVVELAR